MVIVGQSAYSGVRQRNFDYGMIFSDETDNEELYDSMGKVVSL